MCHENNDLHKKEDFTHSMASFLKLWAMALRPSDFRSGNTLKIKLPKLSAFLDLTEYYLRLYRTSAPVLQSLLACKQFSYFGFVIIKCVIDLYLSIAL